MSHKDIRIVVPNQGMKRQQPRGCSIQAQIEKGVDSVQKEIHTKKIPVSKKETRILPASPPEPGGKKLRLQTPKGQQQVAPQMGETWIEKKASGKDGLKRRCLVTLVYGDNGVAYVMTVSRAAYDHGDMCPPFIQDVGAFLRIWERMP